MYWGWFFVDKWSFTKENAAERNCFNEKKKNNARHTDCMIHTWVCSQVKPTNYLGTTNQTQNRKTSEKARSMCPMTSQRLNFVQVFGSLAEGSESNTNLAMHLGAIAQWISRLHAWVRPIINAMPCGLVSEVHLAFLRAFELQSSDCRRTPSATHGRSHGRKKNIIFVSLSCGGFSSGFSCCFHSKYHYDST